jgi:hypothetical protein
MNPLSPFETALGVVGAALLLFGFLRLMLRLKAWADKRFGEPTDEDRMGQ